MKSITKFVATDGEEFKSESACKKYERLLVKIQKVELILGRKPKDSNCNFSNGDGYVQHSKKDVLAFKSAIVELCRKYCKHEVFNYPLKEIYPMGLGGRILDDSNSPIRRPWNRLCCIDEKYREWGQPYYALHPNEGKQVEWRVTK